MDVFVSVGTGLSPNQEGFIEALEARLRAVGLTPCTIGRNTFSADAPLRAVTDLMRTYPPVMDNCAGAKQRCVDRKRIAASGISKIAGRRRPALAQR